MFGNTNIDQQTTGSISISMYFNIQYVMVIILCQQIVSSECYLTKYEKQLEDELERDLVIPPKLYQVKTKDQPTKRQNEDEEEVLITRRSNNAGLMKFLKKLWHQRSNSALSSPQTNKKRSHKRYVLGELCPPEERINKNQSVRRDWMPQKDSSKHSSSKQKDKGIGIWGRKREVTTSQSNVAGEKKKDLLLMLINGLA